MGQRFRTFLRFLIGVVAIAAVVFAIKFDLERQQLRRELEALGVGGELLQARALYITHLCLENMKLAVQERNFGDALREVPSMRAALQMASLLEVNVDEAYNLLGEAEASLQSPTPETPQKLETLGQVIERISPRPFQSLQGEAAPTPAPAEPTQPEAVPAAPPAEAPGEQPAPAAASSGQPPPPAESAPAPEASETPTGASPPSADGPAPSGAEGASQSGSESAPQAH